MAGGVVGADQRANQPINRQGVYHQSEEGSDQEYQVEDKELRLLVLIDVRGNVPHKLEAHHRIHSEIDRV